MMENESSPPEEVAKVILQAITSENPLGYTVGRDAETMIEARVNMPEKQFKKMITQKFSI
jgi:hypothetical protein